MLLKKRGYFNSRPHEEVDEGNKIHGLQEDISTHDLTKRSTSALYADTPKLSISTHDLTKRSTKYAALFKLADSTISTHDLTKRSTVKFFFVACKYTFQLTTSRRGRHDLQQMFQFDQPFQLTTSRRGRLSVSLVLHGLTDISTHDLTKRSTVSLCG